MARTIAVSITPKASPTAVDSLQPQPLLFYAVEDGNAQLYQGDRKVAGTSRVAGDNAFLMDMHASRARNADELAAIVRLYVKPDHEIAPVALPEVTPDPIRFELSDWRKADHADTASWPDDPIAEEPREVIVTHSPSRIDITMPVPGDDHHGAIALWLELQGNRLIAHCYDPAHDAPLNLRIGETAILIDTQDRDVSEAPGSSPLAPRASVR